MKRASRQRRMTSWGTLACSFLIVAVGMALLIAGCSDNGIVLNNNTVSDESVSFFDIPYDTDALAKCADIVEAEVVYVESPLSVNEGGVIALGADENVEAFIVLPGSFPTDTTFIVEVTRIVTQNGETPTVFTFGPDGLRFSRPAVLRLNIAELLGRNIKAVDLYWLNESANSWEYKVTLEMDSQNYVYGSIEHFSQYAIGAAGSGTAK